ncbi:hypothetical protein B4135_2032 [Caldibacillus debilis]|uniref:Uncharacterized protein n=1 Tax=Caldibacillus debilis TaxID=301148 RepID=A0A150M792_9BACI|nr:hypothetical protein B4135_2032 [Caldibacillus debilis]
MCASKKAAPPFESPGNFPVPAPSMPACGSPVREPKRVTLYGFKICGCR